MSTQIGGCLWGAPSVNGVLLADCLQRNGPTLSFELVLSLHPVVMLRRDGVEAEGGIGDLRLVEVKHGEVWTPRPDDADGHVGDLCLAQQHNTQAKQSM